MKFKSQCKSYLQRAVGSGLAHGSSHFYTGILLLDSGTSDTYKTCWKITPQEVFRYHAEGARIQNIIADNQEQLTDLRTVCPVALETGREKTELRMKTTEQLKNT